MTRSTIHSRMLCNLRDQKTKLNKRPIHRHDVEKPDGVKQKYAAELIGKEKKLLHLNCHKAYILKNIHNNFLSMQDLKDFVVVYSE